MSSGVFVTLAYVPLCWSAQINTFYAAQTPPCYVQIFCGNWRQQHAVNCLNSGRFN